MKRGVNGGVNGGEIVQVEGGHIIRSTGRKDRHSKVFKAKGPRDRRVRLSAHTAIQFYDVQDRLGYDRPSKAVDWLIKKAKNAIDKLAELPPWNPNDGLRVNNNIAPSHEADAAAGSNGYEFQFHKPPQSGETSSFMMQEHDTQSIAETMKSFFPMNSGSSLMNFQNYLHEIMPPRAATIQTEDLGLSLHTANPVSFEANFSRMVGWAHPPPAPPSAAAFSQGGAFSQREPLQSNYSHLIHAWEERAATLPSAISNHTHFAAEFQVPARIHGEEEEEHGGMADIKPSSPLNSHY